MYSRLDKFIREQPVPNQEGVELIELNTRKGPDTYYDDESFKNAYFDYMCAKYKKDELTTDPINNCQVVGAVNALYLDGDWYFPDNVPQSEYNSDCFDLADKYLSAWCEELDANNIYEYYYFTFIPCTFPDKKAGFHAMIICKDKIPADMRIRMYDTVKRSFTETVQNECSQYIRRGPDETIEMIYNHLFDIGPLKSMQLLLPFAQKSKSSRQYYLRDHSFNFDRCSLFFIQPTVHGMYDTLSEQSIKSDISGLIEDNDESIMTLMKEIDQNSVLNFGHLGRAGKITAEFMQSLVYLSDGHAFWGVMKDNDKRLRYVITPLIQFIAVNYFIENRGYLPDNENNQFIHTLVKILLPLLKKTTQDSNEKTERDTYKSCYEHVKNYYNKYSGINSTFTDENVNFWRTYCIMTPKERKNMPNDGRKILGVLKKKFQKMFSNWVDFIYKIIIDGMTDEIEPFRERTRPNENPRLGVTFDDVIHAPANVNASVIMDESFYEKTIRMWCLMFLFVSYYNEGTITEAIRVTISCFIRYYIWEQKAPNGSNEVYIYNIHQTKSLTSFPYNQWILDTEDCVSLKFWIKTIYLHFIRKELETANKTHRIIPFVENLANADIPIQDNYVQNIKPLGNFDSDMDKIFKNVLSAFQQDRYAPPKELNVTASPFFPMRNGILEFLENGKVKFHYDNHDKFMNGYTNIIWDENYDYSCPEYKKISKMVEDIYPVPEEREYILRLYSSVLNGQGLKDVFTVMYGTGGDGKTTMSNAIHLMLGGEGMGSHVQMEENGKIVFIENPCGLATSMKTETILAANKSSHDEGGVIQLKGKRYCSVQEPDPSLSNGRLNIAKIKDILSGTTITARGIYKKSESFVPNCLLTLQTNVMLGYSEDSEGMRRRINIVPHRAKFTTSVNKDKMQSLEHKHDADGNLSTLLANNPRLWQAMFYLLLPYAQEALTAKPKKYIPISNIPRPASIVEATEESFKRSNGLVGWLCTSLGEYPGKAICIKDIIETVMQLNNAGRKEGKEILTSIKPRGQVNEIVGQLMSSFIGKMYQLRDEFKNPYKTALRKDFSFVVPADCKTNEKLIERYFNKYALVNLSNCVSDFSDVYIVGYSTHDDESDEFINDGASGAAEPKLIKQKPPKGSGDGVDDDMI